MTTQISLSFGSMQPFDEETAIQAAKVVCNNANSLGDAILIMDVLGLLNPQPGNEPADSPIVVSRKKQKAKEARAELRRLHMERVKRAKESNNA